MLKIELDTSNDAFADGNQSAEVARILRHAASMIERGSHGAGLRDINGNEVGRFSLERPPMPNLDGSAEQ